MSNEKRLIDANALKWKLGQVTLHVPWLRSGKIVISKVLEAYRQAAFEEIDNAPTVDAVEVVHSWWEKSTEGYRICHHCKADVAIFSGHKNYCPNCGADMRGEENGQIGE